MKNILKLAIAITVATATTALASKETERFGQWSYFERRDAFDDTNRSYIVVPSSTGSGYLTVRIMSDGVNIVYGWGSYMGGDRDDDVIVRYRIKGQPASKPEYWRLLQGNRAAYIRMNRVKAVIAEFVAAERKKTASTEKAGVVFRVTDPLDGETKDADFSLDGFTEAWRRLSR